MILYRLFLLFDAIFMILPVSFRRGFFQFLGRIAHKFAGKRNKIIQKNLEYAFGDSLTPEIRIKSEIGCYKNLVSNVLQVMENRRLPKEEVVSSVQFENLEHITPYLERKQPIIFVSGHFGNWEVGGVAMASRLTPISTIYKGFENARFDPYLKIARSRFGLDPFEKNGALKHMAKTLKNGKSLMILIDQASNKKNGILVDFFNHPTYHTTGPASLAAKFGAPIVGVYAFPNESGQTTLKFLPPVELSDSSEDSLKDGTQKIVDDLEKMIRLRPDLWFWCHKRWKGENPSLYENL